MPQYKVSYFNIKGLGEPVRFLLSYGGIDFEDNRIEYPNWPKIKPTTPFGQVPVLEIDGKQYAHSVAICQYLAKKLKIYGKTDEDAAAIDGIAEAITDIRRILSQWFRESDPAVKESKKDLIFKEYVPYYFNKFDEIVKANGGYFHNGELSYVDLFFVALVSHMSFFAGFNITENRPNLRALEEKVLAIPNIKKWVEKHPHVGA